VSAEGWGELTVDDFKSYRALILGDPDCGNSTDAISAAEANRAVWSDAITGNIFLVGTAPSHHAIGEAHGGDELNRRGIDFAASDDQETGLFATLSCYYEDAEPMTNVPVFDQFGSFSVTRVTESCDDAHIVAVDLVEDEDDSSAFEGLTDADLSNWDCSVHEAFDSFPSEFIPFAIEQGEAGPYSLDFPDESSGIPYILARGVTPVLCGDGELNGGFEHCDEGDLVDGDGCNSICRTETPIVHASYYPLLRWPEAIQFNKRQDRRAYIALQESEEEPGKLDIHDVFDRNAVEWKADFVPDGPGECPSGTFSADEVALFEEDGEVDALVSGSGCGIVGVDVTEDDSVPFEPSLIDIISVDFGLVEEVAWTESADGQNLILYAASYWHGLQIFEVVGDCGASGCVVNPLGAIGIDDEWGASLAVWVEVRVEDGEERTLAYVASTEGLQVVDVSVPTAPKFLGRYPTNPDNIPLQDLEDVPQDVVVSGGLAFVPLWIGGFAVIDVSDPELLDLDQPEVLDLAQPVIPASEGSAFFKVEVSSHDNRIYVTEGLYGVAVFIQNSALDSDPEADPLLRVTKAQFAVGEDDPNCSFDEGGVSTNCWAWGIDEVEELLGVTYGVLDTPLSGGYQLITMPAKSIDNKRLKKLRAAPVPEPHLLILQGVGVLAVAGLGRLRRRRRERSARS
jgi:cysteine-rich repeat protein